MFTLSDYRSLWHNAPNNRVSNRSRNLGCDCCFRRKQVGFAFDRLGKVLQSRRNHGREEAAVVDARPQPIQRLTMFRDRVALVGLKTITRTIQRQRAHQAVARHLGDDRCRRNRHHNAVAADHRVAIAGRVDLVAAVDKYVPWHLGQRTNGARQRP